MKAGFIVSWCALSLWATLAAPNPDAPFLTSVKPLLDSRCVSCHGPDKSKGGLRLDSREAALKGGDSGPAVVPGKPSESLLLQAVLHTKKDLEMPPREKLSVLDIAALEKWIREGAPWPGSATPPIHTERGTAERLGNAWSDPRNPIVRLFGGQRLDLWSFQQLSQPAIPRVRNERRVRNPIDSFVFAKIEEAHLAPAPEANRRVLARRLYFDLTGLPPTPEGVREFVQDESPSAYERLVDRLLDSKEYGEHWARQWLDVVRYSDSNGFDWDEFRPNAWRFRDYVIRSFNSDKPFDQFIREQLAGDELLSTAPANQAEQDSLIATGYLRLGPHDNSAAAFNEQARSRAELMADLVDTTGSAFLGLTLSCCRCHDHKFDPLSQADHFRMRAFFEGVKFADDLPLDFADVQKTIREHNLRLAGKIQPLQAERDQIAARAKERLREERISHLSPGEQALLGQAAETLTAEQKERREALEKKIKASDKEVRASFTSEQKDRDESLVREIGVLKKLERGFTLGLLMTDNETPPPSTKILFQGDYKNEREAVEPGFPSALDPNPAPIQKGANQTTLGRRLALANWIASPANPLTARVFVNRVWQGHFGRGFVDTPNDFGLAGARPTHPELLDWLAGEFVRGGWSVKRLHRLIVTSTTYRQASSAAAAESPTLIKIGNNPGLARAKAIDAENRLLSRQNIRRLSAEQLRDALLAVSGALVSSPGGPPVWPELPKEILVANPAFLDDNAEKTKGWYPSPKPAQNARSIFLVQKRTMRIPFLETFDLPENATSCARRNESVVAPQALSLLNNELTIEAAKSLARRAQCGATRREDQAERAFRFALQRAPDSEELESCVQLAKARGLPELCRALLNANEFLYID